MSLRVQRSFTWIGGWAGVLLAWAVAGAVGALVILVARGRARRCRLPLLTMLMLPVLFALNPMASYQGQARYVMSGSSMGALLVGVALERSGVWGGRLAVGISRWTGRGRATLGRSPRRLMLWPVGVALLGALGLVALDKAPPRLVVGFDAGGVPMPADDSSLQSLVTEHHVHYAFATYWIAYRITFETNGATEATAFDNDRYPPIAETVQRSKDPVDLFVASSLTARRLERWCEVHGIEYAVWHDGLFTAVRPDTTVLPSELPEGILSVVTK